MPQMTSLQRSEKNLVLDLFKLGCREDATLDE